MSLKMAVLGLLTDSPKSGYEIKIHFRDSVRNFWHVSDGQLYPTLRSLTDEGMIQRKELSSANGLKKHEYSLSATGRKSFLNWLRETDSPVPEMKEPFLLKLMFFEHLTPAEQIAHIQAQIELAADLIEEYREGWRQRLTDAENPYLRTVADAGLILLEARKMFMEQLKKGVERGNITARIPLFDEETIELAKEVVTQLLDLFEATGQLTIGQLLDFTRSQR